MSADYDWYLREHISSVGRAYYWLASHFPDIAKNMQDCHLEMFAQHDNSKYGPEEYRAYDDYFYGGNRSYSVVKNFNLAWLHHIHNNPHHWQYWILQHDDEGEEILEMPYRYAIEMICDWWSFSFRSGDLKEIFSWYEEHKNMKLHPKTRELVESILGRIKNELKLEAVK